MMRARHSPVQLPEGGLSLERHRCDDDDEAARDWSALADSSSAGALAPPDPSSDRGNSLMTECKPAPILSVRASLGGSIGSSSSKPAEGAEGDTGGAGDCASADEVPRNRCEAPDNT